jgi:H/ACA ribonucleoprotein complex subunit 4
MKSINELLEFSMINLDKPSGPTSYQVSDYVRERLGLRKTSHLGTLDPAVSGVLPIALNRACKLSTYLMRKNKTYVGIMRLHSDVTDNILKETMSKFVGTITQTPPLRSNVKRAPRERLVHSFNFIEREGKDVLFEAEVEAGTYIRTIISDLGKIIGGAHMLELRRTRAGVFSEEQSITLYEFDAALEQLKDGNEDPLRKILIPAEEIIKRSMHCLEVKKESVPKLLSGKPLYSNDIAVKKQFKSQDFVALFSGSAFIEIAQVVNRGEVIAKPDFVCN